VLPGPSAAIAALVASGLPSDRWTFVGFLPRKRAELERLFADTTATLVAFESPRRLPATLRLLAEADRDREAAVCRELTKLHEEVVRGTAADLCERYREPPKGEVVLVVAGAGQSADTERAVQAVARLVEAGARPRAAAAVVAELTGESANTLYRAYANT